EHLLVVLLELLDETDEVAVAADDDEGVDVRMREGHLEGIEGQVDVGAVLVTARRQVALNHLDGVLREVPAVVAGTLPVAVGGLRDDLPTLLERFEDEACIKRCVEGVLDADLDVVEVDENSYAKTFVASHAVLSRMGSAAARRRSARSCRAGPQSRRARMPCSSFDRRRATRHDPDATPGGRRRPPADGVRPICKSVDRSAAPG